MKRKKEEIIDDRDQPSNTVDSTHLPYRLERSDVLNTAILENYDIETINEGTSDNNPVVLLRPFIHGTPLALEKNQQ